MILELDVVLVLQSNLATSVFFDLGDSYCYELSWEASYSQTTEINYFCM